MGEYGNAIGNGAAGQVGGGSGAAAAAGGGGMGDPFANIRSFVDNAAYTFSTMNTLEQVLVVAVVLFVAVLVLRRAF